MNQIYTHYFQKEHRSGKISWVLQWKDPKTARWVRRAAGRTENEAKLLEAQVR